MADAPNSEPLDAAPPAAGDTPVRADSARHEREQFFGAAKLVAAVTLLSRFAGMFRATAIASLGANAFTDALAFAWRIPNLFRRLFAEGALSSAFVPVFTEMSKDPAGGEEKARRLLANSMGILSVFLTAITVLIQGGLLLWVLLVPGSAERRTLLGLIVVMMPFVVTICLLALGSAALNCRGRFLYPAAAPILLNGVIIAGAWLVAPHWSDNLPAQLFLVGVSVTVAGVIQLIGIGISLRRAGFTTRMTLRPVESGIGPMLRLMAPMLLGLGLLQLMELVESTLAWQLRAEPGHETFQVLGMVFHKPLDVGVLQRLDAARYLYQFPLGVLAISLGVAVFPLMSRYAARGDIPSLRDSLNRALRLALMEGLATGTGLFVLAEPITWLLYRHGEFRPSDVAQSAGILRMYVLGMWAYCSYQILARAFYALKDTTTPLKVSVVLQVVYLALMLCLLWAPGVGPKAFGLATATVFGVNTFTLAYLLRRRLGRIGARKLLISVGRTILACAAMAGGILALERWVLAFRPPWLVVAVCVPAGAALFLAAAFALRAPELGELFGALRKKKAA